MFTSIPWKRGLIGFVAVGCIAIAIANGNSSNPQSPSFAAKTLLASSEAPPQIRSILQRACQDCHSNNTVWPWYADIPPISWRIRSDVERGRATMNLSQWSDYSDRQRRGFMLAILAATKARVMPPPEYVWMHGKARLSDADVQELGRWALAPRSSVNR